jgi:hypothetical protein
VKLNLQSIPQLDRGEATLKSQHAYKEEKRVFFSVSVFSWQFLLADETGPILRDTACSSLCFILPNHLEDSGSSTLGKIFP